MLPPRPQLIDIRAKNNRFVPLKDGAYSPDLERSLLGADVNRIVDSLSFGWYESLFQSYMASRVVSSMGEQSVGKSFALNQSSRRHFVCWDALIVALDFEGVHTISNLVLFRNNFALNRDITGLFQAFQSTAPAVIFSLLGPLDDAFTPAMPAHPTATSNNELAVSGDVNDQ
ncbi:hypothetical protein EV363DRAFT_1495120 [Boletus edulis]|nr:hypothetical protein EV363DRAFT_1495120 [Boletus edulis]